VGLNTSSNEIKVRFVQICFQSLAYLKCTCEDMLDLMRLPEKTFAKQYLFGCFSSNNSDLVCFAVGYKSTKSSRHGKNFPHDISIISLSSECSGTLCFSLIIIIIMMILSC